MRQKSLGTSGLHRNAHTATDMTVDNVPGSGGKLTPNRKVDKLTSRRRGQLSYFFTDMTEVPASPFSSSRSLLTMTTIWEGKATSVRFFTVSQNWAIFSFTLERKKVSLQ
ncbi:hypothetical protein TNCV_3408191 [Trichonephila clavipes]|nr:hypothetical protein TNCV_3408191 [Trichonephila clavipes]